MIQALGGAISLVTGLLWVGLAIFVVIYLRKPIFNLMDNLSNLVANLSKAEKGKIPLGLHMSLEWQRSMEAVANLTAAAVEKKQADQELPRIVNSVAASMDAAVSGAVAGKNVLWVDDEPWNNTYGKKALESQGINVVISKSTTDALNQIKTHDVAAIVTDQLRVENRTEDHEAGTHLLEAVRKLGVQTPVILSTAFPNKLEARNRGFFGATNTQHGVYELVMQAIAQRTTAKRT